jgi:hypothetical protein
MRTRSASHPHPRPLHTILALRPGWNGCSVRTRRLPRPGSLQRGLLRLIPLANYVLPRPTPCFRRGQSLGAAKCDPAEKEKENRE